MYKNKRFSFKISIIARIAKKLLQLSRSPEREGVLIYRIIFVSFYGSQMFNRMALVFKTSKSSFEISSNNCSSTLYSYHIRRVDFSNRYSILVVWYCSEKWSKLFCYISKILFFSTLILDNMPRNAFVYVCCILYWRIFHKNILISSFVSEKANEFKVIDSSSLNTSEILCTALLQLSLSCKTSDRWLTKLDLICEVYGKYESCTYTGNIILYIFSYNFDPTGTL